jgi:PAN domain
MTRSSIAFLLSLCLCVFATATYAQSPSDMIDRFKHLIHSAIAKAAKSRWSTLPDGEYSCVNKKLEERGESIQFLVKRGVFPNDRRVARVRSECHGLSPSQQFRRIENRAYKRSGQDILITASNYDECENACSESSSCAAVTYFRSAKICRIMQSATELAIDNGADSAIRIEPITGSVAPQTPTVTERAKSDEPATTR